MGLYLPDLPAYSAILQSRHYTQEVPPMEVPAHLLDASNTAVPVNEDKLEKAKKFAQQLFDMEQRKEELETELSELNVKKLELQHRTIPEFLAEIGVDVVGLEEVKADVKVKPYYKASIAADWEEAKKTEAFKALDQNGGGALIRATVAVVFAKEEYEDAKGFMEFVRQKWPGANRHEMELSMTVPWNSLTSWMRVEHEAGRSLLSEDKKTVLPWSTIGGEVGRIAKVEKRKK